MDTAIVATARGSRGIALDDVESSALDLAGTAGADPSMPTSADMSSSIRVLRRWCGYFWHP
jgi:hypothetical protein